MTDDLPLKASTEASERSLEETYVLLANEIPHMAKEVQDAHDSLLARALSAEPEIRLRSWLRRMASSSFRRWRKHPLPFYSQPTPNIAIEQLRAAMRAEDRDNAAYRIAIHSYQEEASAVELRRRLQLTDGEILGLEKLHAMKIDHTRRLSPARVLGLVLATVVILLNQIPKEVFGGDGYADFARTVFVLTAFAIGYLLLIFGYTWFSMWRGKSRFQAVGRALSYMEADRLRRSGKIE